MFHKIIQQQFDENKFSVQNFYLHCFKDRSNVFQLHDNFPCLDENLIFQHFLRLDKFFLSPIRP